MPVQLHHCLTFQGDENSYYNTDELSNTDILRSALDTVSTTEQLLTADCCWCEAWKLEKVASLLRLCDHVNVECWK